MKQLWLKIRRWYFARLSNLAYWLGRQDVCELCGEEIADGSCVGCERSICMNCDSRYYEDEVLCTACRKDITPEEEAADREEMARYEAESIAE
jgi:hypothetical protein